MGEVYLAQDVHLGRGVALKVLPVGFAGDQDSLALCGRETEAASALNHPNVTSTTSETRPWTFASIMKNQTATCGWGHAGETGCQP